MHSSRFGDARGGFSVRVKARALGAPPRNRRLAAAYEEK
jgi:hypothetical protein